jgi:FG-GAP repeat
MLRSNKNKEWFVIMVVLVMCLATVSVVRANWVEQDKLIALDATAGDDFGQVVAIDGDIAIVGAPWDDDVASKSGSAYLFDVTTGTQLFKLTAADAEADDASLGVSVAISDNIAIVGAQGDDHAAGIDSGSAYLFDVTTGTQLAKLTAYDATPVDLFGCSVAISGNIAIVGSNLDDDAGSKSGSAYLFDVSDPYDPIPIQPKLTAYDAAAGDEFGRSVAISGNTAIVGAFRDDDAGSDSGSAYLFDVVTGNQLFKLTASDAAAGDYFGYSVAISGNTAIVGSYRDDDSGADSGSAYLFDVITGNQLAKITASDAAAGDWFGRSVAINGNTAVVGAYMDDEAGSDSGSAYLFDITTGVQLAKITASDCAAGDRFGMSVAISCNTTIVGAYYDDDAGTDSGSAYVFAFRQPHIEAIIDIDPDTLNMKSHGKWITVYITLPDGFDVGTIDTSSIAITSLIGETCDPEYTQEADLSFTPQVCDRDEDSILDLTVKFDRQVLLANLCLDDVSITIEGELTTGELFSGSDSIRIIDRGK